MANNLTLDIRLLPFLQTFCLYLFHVAKRPSSINLWEYCSTVLQPTAILENSRAFCFLMGSKRHENWEELIMEFLLKPLPRYGYNGSKFHFKQLPASLPLVYGLTLKQVVDIKDLLILGATTNLVGSLMIHKSFTCPY